MGRGRRRRKRSLGGGCGGWNEGGKGREGIYTCLGLFFTTNWEEFAALGVHTSSPSLPYGEVAPIWVKPRGKSYQE